MTDKLLSLAREVGAGIDICSKDVQFTSHQLTAFAERIRQDEREKNIRLAQLYDAANTGSAGACIAAAIRGSKSDE